MAARSVFRDAVTGSGQLMLISGEAGIGKTAVLAALLDDAARDCTVLRGLCWEGAGGDRTARTRRRMRLLPQGVAATGDGR